MSSDIIETALYFDQQKFTRMLIAVDSLAAPERVTDGANLIMTKKTDLVSDLAIAVTVLALYKMELSMYD